jgi:PhnB protein
METETKKRPQPQPAGQKDPVSPIPKDHHSVTPSLTIRGADEAIAFYERAFGAELRYRFDMPDGKIGHVEMKIGDSFIMLSEEDLSRDAHSPLELKGSPVTLFIYDRDVDALFQRAVGAGAQVTMPVADQFWGDRMGGLIDPFGHRWVLATHKEDLTDEEIRRRGAEFMAKV